MNTDLLLQLEAEVLAVLDAWTDPGPMPRYHREMQAKLRREWPVLARALDAATARGPR